MRHHAESASRLIATAVFVASLSLTAPTHAQSWEPFGEPGSGGRITGMSISPHDPDRVLIAGDMLSVGISTNGGDTWDETFGFASWEAADFTWHPTDPTTVWVGTMSGPYKSTDGGVNWTSQRSGMSPIAPWNYSSPIERVMFDPNDDDRLLAIGGSSRRWGSPGSPDWGAIWESTNGGDSWSRLSTLTASGSSTDPTASGINTVSAEFGAGSSTRLYAGADGEGFYRSDDGGVTWQKKNTGLPQTNIARVVANPVATDFVYVSLDADGSTPGGIYLSPNGGDSWTPINGGLDRISGASTETSSRYQALAIAPSAPSILYTGDARFGSQIGVARTVTGAGPWTTTVATGDVDTFDPAGIQPEVITVDPSNANRVLAAGSAYILETEDGGQTWEDITSVRVDEGYVGNGFTGWVSTAVEFNPLDPDHVIVQGFDAARVLQTKDGGANWTREATSTGNFEGGRDVVFAGQNTIYATLGQNNFQGIARSTDAGDSWTVLSGAGRGLPSIGGGLLPDGIYASPSDPTTVWAAVEGDLLRSTNSGDTWSVALNAPDVRWIAEDPNAPDTFYVSSDVGVYRTADGINFDFIDGPDEPGKMEVDANGDLLFAAHDISGDPGAGLWRWDGDDWTQLFADTYAVDVTVDPTDPMRIAVTTSDDPFHDVSRASGVYLSEDGGSSWRSINDGLPMLRGATITFNPHEPSQLVLGTGGRGFYTLTLGITGDYNNDGLVDAADYTVWRDNRGSTQQLAADGNGDGIVDDGDYDVWRANFGRGSVALPAIAIPEPLSGGLLLLAVVSFLGGPRKE
ncbi:MAG: hypothetical protein AAFV43_15110 [Planctomycetota bacterium]